MLNLLPELQWLAVNRTGGKLSVLVYERSIPEQTEEEYGAANIVASREGVLTEISVLEGMKLCTLGDTVTQGQVLVSGYEDYGLCVKAVRANAEIYAMTWHSGTVVTPTQTMEKQYTGVEWTQCSIIIGRKRINLYGNSGISTDNCDKMINEKVLSLPGGHEFPVILETVVYREYTLVPCDTQQEQAEELLHDAWKRMTLESMIAGEIQGTTASVLRSGELYVLNAESTCTEMIARVMPISILPEQ